MVTSTNLAFTFIEQSQSQKEVTANAALTAIDALLNTGAIDKDLTTPPGSPATGDLYIVAASPTGAWSGKENNIAYFNQVWKFLVPKEGMRLWVRDEDKIYVWNGSAWGLIAITEFVVGSIDTVANKDYTLVVDMPYAAVITETTTQSASGTCTATFKINTTAMGGTVNSVSSTKQSRTQSSPNAAAIGDKIVMTVSSNSSCLDLAYRVAYTRSL